MPLFDATPTAYRPVIELARGGMGSVSLVVRDHGPFERLHALKRLHPSLRDDDDVRSMFLDEARIAGLIRHPNVVSVTDVGEDTEGPFLVMDYVEGVSLSRLLKAMIERGRQLPMGTALEIMRQVAAGLQAAHELVDGAGRPLGVIHRDISPQNILLGFDGYARLTDFGIAKAVGRTTKTQTGILKGKIGYLAPEVLRFEDVDHRSDLFSFGVVLYECLAMRRLYPSREGPKSARAILNDPPPDLGDEVPDAPDPLVELLFSLLAKDPAHRPATAGEVAERLERIHAEVTIDVPAISIAALLEEEFPGERADRARRVEEAARRAAKRRRRPWLWAGAAAVLLASAGVGASVALVPDPDPTATEPEAPVGQPPAVATAPPEVASAKDAGPASAEEAPEAAEAEAGDASEMTERTTRRRRRPRRRPRSQMTLAPMWDWQ